MKDYVTKADLEDAIAQIVGAISKTLENMATKDDLKGVENRLGKVENRLDGVEAEVKDVKRSINDLKADLPTPQEFKNHEKRISRLETTVFPS